MVARSKVDLLPDDLKKSLNKRLVEAAFADYENLSDWLAEQGYAISKSSIHRYGRRYEQQIERLRVVTDTAERLVAAAPDDKSALAQATVQLAQEKLFDIFLASDEGDASKLLAACSALAKLTTSQNSLEKLRHNAKIAERAAAAERAGEVAERRGLTPATTRALRKAIEGDDVEGEA